MTHVSDHIPDPLTSPEDPPDAVLGWLSPRITWDPVLAEVLTADRLRLDGASVALSGVDRAACTLASTVLREVYPGPGRPSVALALPRGHHSLALIVGIHLALRRRHQRLVRGRNYGSVLVTAGRTGLRELATRISLNGDPLPHSLALARLAVELTTTGRLRAAALPLDGGHRRGLSQRDELLLFTLPSVAPPMAENVVSINVLDTAGVARATWNRVAERDNRARRRLVVIGELGSADLEGFCAEWHMPLIQFSWELIDKLTGHYGPGTGIVAATGLADRVRHLPPVGYRIIGHEDCDYELRAVISRLADMRRICREQDPAASLPPTIGDAARLAGLLGRLACPLRFYEEQVPRHRFQQTAARQLTQLNRLRLDGFHGAVQRAFAAHWAMVRGSLERLARLVEDPDSCPKWWALYDRISTAEAEGEPLRIMCVTRAERDGLQQALVEWGLVRAEKIGRLITIVAMRDQPLSWGSGGTPATVLLAPPEPWQESLLCTGEHGRVEVLCYPGQTGMLRRVLGQAFRPREAENLDALSRLGGPTPPTTATASSRYELPLEALPAVELTGWDAPSPQSDPQFAVPSDPAAAFWSEVVDLFGRDLDAKPDGDATSGPDAEEASATATATAISPMWARRIDLEEGYSVFVAEASACEVLLPSPGRDPELVACPPSQLAAGMRIVLLPGSDRGVVLQELLTSWDERLGLAKPHFQGLYRRALTAAVDRHGVDGVASLVGVDVRTIKSWLAGDRAPQQSRSLERLLAASGDEEAYGNRAAIRALFATVRGRHRLIGRELNAAVTECVFDGRQGPHLHRLEDMVGRDLKDLFAAVVVCTVQGVQAERVAVPRALIGELLDGDHPAVNHRRDQR
jgi:hypothetical protein